MHIIRTEEEINELLDRIADVQEGGHGSEMPGLTFEEGVRDAFRWLTDEKAPHPLDG